MNILSHVRNYFSAKPPQPVAPVQPEAPQEKEWLVYIEKGFAEGATLRELLLQATFADTFSGHLRNPSGEYEEVWIKTSRLPEDDAAHTLLESMEMPQGRCDSVKLGQESKVIEIIADEEVVLSGSRISS